MTWKNDNVCIIKGCECPRHPGSVRCTEHEIAFYRDGMESWRSAWFALREAAGKVSWSEYYRGAGAKIVYDEEYGRSFYAR
jgi:hypothetical protein